MSNEPPRSNDERLGLHDLPLIAGVLLLGFFGYLCDTRSPLIRPVLPIFGLFWVLAFLALFLGCIFQAVTEKRPGWIIGLFFGLFPLFFFLALKVVLDLLLAAPQPQ